jgi:hypothetical protein
MNVPSQSLKRFVCRAGCPPWGCPLPNWTISHLKIQPVAAKSHQLIRSVCRAGCSPWGCPLPHRTNCHLTTQSWLFGVGMGGRDIVWSPDCDAPEVGCFSLTRASGGARLAEALSLVTRYALARAHDPHPVPVQTPHPSSACTWDPSPRHN